MTNLPITGLWPALLTPVGPDGALGTARAVAHAQRMLAAGCEGVTLFGTTGEGPAFTVPERQGLLESMLGAGIGANQLIVTTTALALGDAIALGRHASGLGVHRQMLMPPFFFNQPRDAGIVQAVSSVVQGIADARLQLLLYHFPAMSTFGFSHSAIAELVRRHGSLVAGVKDSSGDLAHALALVAAFPALSILVGAEPQVAPVMCQGGAGSINGLANLAPGLMRRVMDAPQQVRADDSALMAQLLALLSVRSGLPFVAVYKAMLAEQTGDDLWLNMRPPLSLLTPDELHTVRTGYRAIGDLLAFI
jgi:4-hydroxy-tetrahydrodipicolinate synthase